MNQLRVTPGEWKQATGIGYCCIRTGSMNDRTGGVIADMRLVDGVYNPFDACLIASSKTLYQELERAGRLLEEHGDYAASERIVLVLEKARGKTP